MPEYSIYDLGYGNDLSRGDAVAGEAPASPVPASQAFSGGGSGGSYAGGLVQNPTQAAMAPNVLTSGDLSQIIFSGKQTFTDATAGFRQGVDADGTFKWVIGTGSSFVDWNVTTPNTLTISGSLSATTGTIGGFSIGSDYIRDAANSFGLSSTVTGGDDVRFWAGAAFADRATAPLRITEAGVLTATGAVINGSPITNNDIFGSGQDGAFALDGSNAYATYFSKSGSTYTLLMDLYATNITMTSSAIIETNGYRIHANGTFNIGSGCVVRRNGNNGANGSSATNQNGAAGGAGGSAIASGSVFGGVAGANGGAGGNASSVSVGNAGTGGSAGAAVTNTFLLGTYSGDGLAAGAGGAGGGTGGGAPFAGGAAGGLGAAGAKTSQSTIRPYSAVYAVQMLDLVAGAAVAFLRYNPGVGGSGGGGGGGGGTAGGINGGGGGGGGGSGSNGGHVMIAARVLINNGSVQAVGGNGGNGGNGFDGLSGAPLNGGGGGGGGGAGGRGGAGGVITYIYSSLSGSGTFSVAGGAGGSAGTGGAAGASGGGIAAAVAGSNGSAGTTGPSGVLIPLAV